MVTTSGAVSGATAVTVGALAAALVWGVHPLRAESVAWVSERRDVLCGLFYLLAVLAYLRGAATAGGGPVPTRWRVASLAAFAAALASKAIAMTLPLTLLLLDLYPLDRRRLGWRRLLIDKLPYAVLGAAAAAIAVATRQDPATSRATSTTGSGRGSRSPATPSGSTPSRLVWPAQPLADLRAAVHVDSRTPLHRPAARGRGRITVALVCLRRRWPGGLAAWAHSAIVLAPVSGLVHSGSQLAHDRYSYVSGLGFAVLAGGTLAWALSRERGEGPAWMPTAASATAAAIIVASLARRRGPSRRVARPPRPCGGTRPARPECAICASNLGRAIARPGRFDEAEALVRRAADSGPSGLARTRTSA